jgi:hypothetical protein
MDRSYNPQTDDNDMNLPDLQRTIEELEKSLTFLECWLFVATLLVVLGLILEYWHEVPEAFADLKKTWSWKPFLIIAGGVLITAGVAGELAVQFFASRKETDLRKANDAVFAILNAKAAEATERAANAELQTVQLKKLAEDERMARVKIEQDVAWRRLTKDQQREMAARLKPFSGETVLLHYNINDLEADSFASDIALTLRQAKWKTVFEPMPAMVMREGPVLLGTRPILDTGVSITSTQGRTSHKLADLICRALRDFGFDAIRRAEDDKRPGSKVFIFVEHRPEGAQGEAKLRH